MNVLNLVIQGIDKTGAAFRSAGANADKFTKQVGGISVGFSLLGGIAGTVLNTLSGLLSGLLGIIGQVVSAVGGALVGAFRTLATVAAAAGAVIGGALLASLTAIGKTGVDMNVTLGRATAALTRIGGSASGAASFIAELRKESETSALTFKDMLPLAQQLVAAYGGFGGVLPTMRAFGDAAAALGVDSEGLQRSLLGFRQLLTRDKPTAEDLGQVRENLPGLDVSGILKKAFGSADTEVLSKAGVTGRQVGAALLTGMQQAFGGTQAQAAGSLPIILSNFADAFNNLSQAVTARFTPQIEAALGKVLALFQGLSANESVIRAVSVVFDLLGAAIGKAVEAAPAFAKWLEQIVTKENVVEILSNVGGGLKTVWEEASNFVAGALGEGGIVGLWDKFKAAAVTGINFVLRAWGGLTAGVDYLIDQWPKIESAAKDAFNGIMGTAERLAGVLEKVAGALGFGGGQGKVIKAGGFGMGGGIENLIQAFLRWVGGGGTNSAGVVRPPVGAGVEQLANIGGGFGAAVTRGAANAPQFGQVAAAIGGRFGANVGAARSAINSILTPSAKPADSDLPPTSIIGAYTGSGAAAPVMDDKAFKEIIQARNSYFGALKGQADYAASMAPEGQKALADAQRTIPVLAAEIKNVVFPQLARYGKDTQEYWSAVGQWYQLAGAIQSKSAAAMKEQSESVKRATASALGRVREAISSAQGLAQAQLGLQEAAIKANPFLSKEQKDAGLLGVMKQRFGMLNQPVPGETEEQRLRRQTEAFQLRGSIFETAGLGMKSVGTLGGGTLDVGNRRGMGALDSELNAIAAASAGRPLEIHLHGALTSEEEFAKRLAADPTFAQRVQQLIAEFRYRESQQAAPGPTF